MRMMPITLSYDLGQEASNDHHHLFCDDQKHQRE
jgi:hypothetical protein